MRGIVGEERRGKETDRCPLTVLSMTLITLSKKEENLELLVISGAIGTSLSGN
jgi:hypothetical protein